jgi:hypothetical protein
MPNAIPRRTPNRCVVCDTLGDFPYDARFDGAACDACHAMLTIKDDVFRRLHPEHEDAIRQIWRDQNDPSRAREVGRLYAEIGYFEEQGVGDEEPDGPDDRIRRLLHPVDTAEEDD